jgi:Transglycosylase-like domain
LIAAVATLVAAVAPAAAATGSGGISTGEESDRAPAEAAKYVRLWDKVSRRERRWARSTAECESGRDPNAIGGGGKYRGAFQFLKSTWRRSPKSPGGDPIDYPYRTQAVVAVALKNRDGAHHWPNCG